MANSLMQIARRESSVLFPSYGRYIAERDVWRVTIQGAMITEAPLSIGKRFLLRLLQKWIDDPTAILGNPVFQTRTRYFLAQPLKRRPVKVVIGSRVFALPKKTNQAGLFLSHVELPRKWIEEHAPGGVLKAQVSWPELDRRGEGLGPLGEPVDTHSREQEIRLVPPVGMSVVSDIDDTIKHTDVASRRELLSNTFLRPFQSIPGMAERYQGWESAGAAFHYVTASPWQLAEELQLFRLNEQFPVGTMHLRAFRMHDHMVRRLLRLPPSAKFTAINNLFRAFPQRTFVLIGDSGEFDPEIYGKLARRYPTQIAGIYIRDLPRKPLDARRTRKVFRRLPQGLVRAYESADELPLNLPTLS